MLVTAGMQPPNRPAPLNPVPSPDPAPPHPPPHPSCHVCTLLLFHDISHGGRGSSRLSGCWVRCWCSPAPPRLAPCRHRQGCLSISLASPSPTSNPAASIEPSRSRPPPASTNPAPTCPPPPTTTTLPRSALCVMWHGTCSATRTQTGARCCALLGSAFSGQASCSGEALLPRRRRPLNRWILVCVQTRRPQPHRRGRCSVPPGCKHALWVVFLLRQREGPRP